MLGIPHQSATCLTEFHNPADNPTEIQVFNY